MKDTASLRRRNLNRSARVAVVGQVYVGLSLGCTAEEASFSVVGLDLDGARISDLSRKILSVPGVNEAALTSTLASGRIRLPPRARARRIAITSSSILPRSSYRSGVSFTRFDEAFTLTEESIE